MPIESKTTDQMLEQVLKNQVAIMVALDRLVPSESFPAPPLIRYGLETEALLVKRDAP